MSKLFLDVLGNMELVDGYQIEDSIVQKYCLQPGNISPWTQLRVESVAHAHKPEAARKKAKR